MKRNINYAFREFLTDSHKESKVLLVEGPRQVGKTYLVKSILENQPNVIKINFEEEPDLRFEVDATRNFEEFTKWLKQKKG